MRKLRELLHYYEARIQEPFYSWLMAAYNCILDITEHPETEHPGGEHTDQTFYVIRLDNQGIGLASFYDEVLGAMKYAERRNYVPVVTISDPECSLVDPQRGGDAWEYYYAGIETNGRLYSAKDAANAANVVFHDQRMITLYKRYSPKEIARRSVFCGRIRYNEETRAYLAEKEKDILRNTSLIGVYYRGTDYKTRGEYVPVGHPKVMEIPNFWDMLIQYAKSVSCSNVFFVTEEQEALDYVLEHKSGLNILYIPKVRFSDFSFDASISSKTLPGVSRYENNLLYLLDLDMLSKCQYLFGPFNSGIQMALNLNGGRYKDVHIVDIGRN